MTRRGSLPSVLLALASVIWGFAFVAQRAGMDHVGPFLFNGVRFLLGAMILLPVLAIVRRRRAPIPSVAITPLGAVVGCTLAGLVLFGAVSLQQIGIVHTTAGKAGFITGLYVMIIPLLGLLRGQRIRWTVWLGVLCAAAGLYLLSIRGALGIEFGDGLVLVGAFGWAVHVQVIGWLAERVRPLAIAVVQFTICGLISLIVGLATETATLGGLSGAAWPIAYAGILSTGVAYTLQIVGQRRVDPTRAGIIFSMEAVFAVLGGWLLLGEAMTARMLGGCALMLAAMVLAQLRRGQRRGALHGRRATS
jgi:drug/metabolite transporter (DMT)-like permease